MKIFNSIKNALTFKKANNDWEIVNISTGEGWSSLNNSDLSEITYYTCLKILSESVAKLSIHLKNSDNEKVKNNDAIYLLKTRPNTYMSPSDFKQLLEYQRNHYGNAYALIEHDNRGKFIGLHPLDPLKVRVLVDNDKLLQSDTTYLFEYYNNGKKYYYRNEDVIHLKGGLSSNGIVGKSIREDLALTLKGVKEAQSYLNELYNSGLTAKAIVQYTGDLNKEKKQALVTELSNFARSKNTGNIVPIPLGMDLKPLDLKLTDAQFFELKQFSSLQIAAAFGVKPNHLNNYDKSSYSNSEMQNLTYYVDTLLFILRKWEEEFDYKLLSEAERKKGYHFEFNVSAILRGDIKSQAEALSKFVQGSIYTIDEARQYLSMPKLKEGGETILVNGSYVDLEDIGLAYKSKEGGEIDD